MKTSWRRFFWRIASLCFAGCASLWCSACCYAAAAMDSASDPVYVNGWQDGDNGGFGFTPWDFSSSLTFGGIYYGQYTDSSFHAIDDGLKSGTQYSNPFNNVGRAWAIGISPTNNGVPRAGRGFTLGIGEILKVVFDNPTDRQFFKGYQINLNGGAAGMGGNICYGGVPCDLGSSVVRKMSFATFEYATDGEWSIDDSVGVSTGVFDMDTAAAGAIFSVKRTGVETYDVSLDSMGGGADFSAMGRMFKNPGAEIDWIDFTFFNTPSDTGAPPTIATDFYIRSMEIVGAAAAADFDGNGSVDGADFLTWQRNFGRDSGAVKAQGDANGDGDVDGDDLATWKMQFGASAMAVQTGVPEPAGWALALVAVWLAAPASIRRQTQAVGEMVPVAN